MRCRSIACANEKTRVLRTYKSSHKVRRERKCEVCRTVFWTTEHVDPPTFKVRKLSGRREKFSIDKLRRSIALACGKLEIESDLIEELVYEVIDVLSQRHPNMKVVTSTDIGQLVLDRLTRLHPSVWVRFASYYYFGRDEEAFDRLKETLEQKLIEDPTKTAPAMRGLS